MIKKTIEYVDFNDQKRKEDFYFNLTKAEIVDLESATKGGLTEKIQLIAAANDVPEIIKIFREILRLSYGVKTPDGRFEKSEEHLNVFLSTNAYSELYYEMVTHPEQLADFVKGIVPKID